MAIKTATRARESTDTTGTGTVDLDGAPTGYRTLVAAVSSGSKTYYLIEDGTDWEVGIGTVTSSTPDTLSRDLIISSSNGDAAVNWGAGTKNVSIVVPARSFDNADYVHVRDEKSSGTAGGTPANNTTYLTRDLNTEVHDDAGICSLASNQFTLDPGVYHIVASVPHYATDEAKAKLRNITDSSDTLIGLSSFAIGDANEESGMNSVIVGRFAISASKAFEIQMRVDVAATDGFGRSHGWGVEVYTDVHLWRIHREF